MRETNPVYPLSAVRTLALQAQGLTAPLERGTAPTSDEIYQIVEQLGCVQIDTLQMVQRSHYLVLWSRLGAYDPTDLDHLVYQPGQRCLFEGWQHASSLIPLTEYRYQMPHQRRLREEPGKWFQDWLSNPQHAALLPDALERIRQKGAVRAGDFKYDGPKRGSWWDWKPAKVALEHLYAYGDLMIAGRINFQRVYDLTERVLPDWVDTSEPTREERDRFWVERAARALGVFQPFQVAEYAFMKRTHVRPYVEEMHAEEVCLPVKAHLADGKVHTLMVHRENISLLEQAADGGILPGHTTFLSPFDNLFWARGRSEAFWNFTNVLEAYKPASQRIWGYFCLPILHKDRLVGRFDPKLERGKGLLRLKALFLEPGIELEGELVAALAEAMRNFLAFHGATDLTIQASNPSYFGEKLLAAL